MSDRLLRMGIKTN